MTPFKLIYELAAKRSLRRMAVNDRRRVIEAIEALAVEPFPHGYKKLEGVENEYRIRVGNYRVCYSPDLEVRELHILAAGPRGAIY